MPVSKEVSATHPVRGREGEEGLSQGQCESFQSFINCATSHCIDSVRKLLLVTCLDAGKLRWI